MRQIFVVLCFIGLFLSHIQAQEEVTVTMPRFRLGIETGANIFIGESNKPAMIRENQSSYNDYYDNDYYCGFVPEEQNFNFSYLGIKPEYSVSKGFVVAMGARFSFNQFILESDQSYFLWKISEDGPNTNYVRINNISQRNYYIGIPMEMKFFPRDIDYFVRHYFVLGTVLNFLIVSDNNVSFQDAAMKKYTSDVLEHIGKPSDFHGQLYMGFGLKIGKTNHPFGNFEFHFPVYMIANDRPNAFVKAEGAFGCEVKAILQIPLVREHQLSYKVQVIND